MAVLLLSGTRATCNNEDIRLLMEGAALNEMLHNMYNVDLHDIQVDVTYLLCSTLCVSVQ